MAGVIYEKIPSGDFVIDAKNPSGSLEYVILATDDRDEMRTLAEAAAPATYRGLNRLTIAFRELGYECWSASVAYGIPEGVETVAQSGDETGNPLDPGEPPADPGDGSSVDDGSGSEVTDPADHDDTADLGSEWSFDTTGGTAHITTSIATRYARMAGDEEAPDLDGAIGATADSVAGVDIVAPKLEWSITWKFEAMTSKYIRILRDLVGTMNSKPFYGYQRGEVLFLGATGQSRPEGGWAVTFRFQVQRNQSNLTIAGITIPFKYGHDYIWTAFNTDAPATGLIKKPFAVYCEQVYEFANFRRLRIGV